MMYRYFLFIIFFIPSLHSNAQTAPDFTVIDSWGQQHRLYQDYLDQGKTVVLKIFYVACPPCNSIAPFLEPLYQDWGGGQADVQFIELSIKQNDSNADVNEYKSMHQTTYPAAGGEGESVAATMPYTSGNFGLWTGTPTFVVIAPDRTLQYDVYGFGNQGTIDALDEAIAATGATGTLTNSHELSDKIFASIENPVTNELRLKLREGDYDIGVFTITGQLLTSKTIHADESECIVIDAKSLLPGALICRIIDLYSGKVASYLCVKS